MTLQRRSYTSLPPYLQTNRNNLELAVTDDLLYEPEQAAFVSGYIGDTSKLTARQLERTPLLIENTKVAQKYQFTIGVAEKDPITGQFLSGAFYDDLINHIAVNGGKTNDPNRLFTANYYVWTPPIDYDKIVNFARYFWTGTGTAKDAAQYILKEAAGSVVNIYQFDGTALVKHAVTSVNGLPGSGSTNEIAEDISTPDRFFYQWNGSNWARMSFQVAVDNKVRPTYTAGDWIYITRTGPDFNRPIVWVYRAKVGRWVSQPVVINIETPTNPVLGMLWEDTRTAPSRVLRIWDGDQWQLLNSGFTDVVDGTGIVYTAADGPSGTAGDVTYLYDTRSIAAVDTWSAANWWRTVDDITGADQEALGQNVQAIRPIVEFWGNIESAAGDTMSVRNQFPLFNLYGVAPTATPAYAIEPINPTNFPSLKTTATSAPGRFYNGQTVSTVPSYNGSNIVSTLFQYVISATSPVDPILGFRTTFAPDGSPTYSLDMEAMPLTYTNGNAVLGYRFFRDIATGYVHSVWQKSNDTLMQEVDDDGLYSVPKNLTSNADHLLTTSTNRSTFIGHFSAVIKSQPGFSGTPSGANSYRYSAKNMTLGGQMIDPEESLFRIMAILQTGKIDIPDAIRMMSRVYNSVMVRFVNQLNTLWNNGTFSTVTDTLKVTTTQACDIILTMLFQGRNQEFPFYLSTMGTFTETRLDGNTPYVFDSTPQPIYIPNSPAQIGTAPAYQPMIFIDHDGVTKIRGHDGSLIPAFSDARDSVIMELENRFYGAVPSYLKEETTTFSSRFNNSRFHLADYYGNFTPNLTAGSVVDVVSDHNTIGSPIAGSRIYSINYQLYVVWDGTQWLTQPAQTGDVFQNTATGDYYIFNGFFTEIIPTDNRNVKFDYSMLEYREVVEREFERFVVNQNLDFVTNTEYDQDDPFTWNFSSAGVEGNYRGIYRRVYNTIRPHSNPWEVLGYSIMPDWWLTSYVPDSTEGDGTHRWGSAHPMWSDLQAGIINQPASTQSDAHQMIAPIPVDDSGNLIDPIASGLIDESALTPSSVGDDWQYGDGGIVEDNWYASYHHAWAVSLAGYLMKPGQFVDRTWSEFYRTIGDVGSNLMFNNPAIVYNSTLTRPQASLVPSQLSLDSAGNPVQNPGLNSWIAEYSVLIGKSANADFNAAIQNSQTSLGWKTAGFINHARTSFELLSSDEIPAEDFSVVLHQGPSTAEYYQSGITIVRDTDGFRVFGTDMLNPSFTVEAGAKPISGGQIELLQNFTYDGNNRTFTVTEFTIPPNTNDTALFTVLINGFSIKSKFIQRLSGTQFSIDPSLILAAGDKIIASMLTVVSNPSTQLGSFQANGYTVTYFQTGTGVQITYPYGTLFETINDVVNMLVGHGRVLGREGWVFERLTNGTLRDWLGAAKAFALWATNLGTTSLGNPLLQKGKIFNYSVMGRHTQFNANFGMILGVENIRNGSYGVVDVNSQPIPADDLDIVSTGGSITVAAGNTDIYGLRVYVSVVQHVVFFPNITIFGDIIYEPALGLFQPSLYVTTYRTTNWNGRMEAPGFLVSGGQIAPLPGRPLGQTPTPTGALYPNWEKQVSDINRYYDRFNPPDDPVLTAMARDLFGYAPKDYINRLAADDRTQFNFYRGTLKTKGTRQPYFAFARGTTVTSDNFVVAEDWAWKFTRYGDRRVVTVLFTVNTNDFVDTYQVVTFDTVSFTQDFFGGGDGCFTIHHDFVPEDVVVLVDGNYQVYGLDYRVIESNGSTEICLSIPPTSSQLVNLSLNSFWAQAKPQAFYNNTTTKQIVTGIPNLVYENMLLVLNNSFLGSVYSLSPDGVIDYSNISGAVEAYAVVFGNVTSPIFLHNHYMGNGFQRSFLTKQITQTVDSLIVCVNGIMLAPDVDYTLIAPDGHTAVLFNIAPPLSATIFIMELAEPEKVSSTMYTTIADGVSHQYNVPGVHINGYRQVIAAVNGHVQVGPIPGRTDVPYGFIVNNGGVYFTNPPINGGVVTIFVILGALGAFIPEAVDNRIIQVPQFEPPDADSRWVIPPPEDRYKNLPYRFPKLLDGTVDLKKYVYTASLVDQTGVVPATSLFHWDPAAGIHEPLALAKIDYATAYDPARYNAGPHAGTDKNLVWSGNQVGQVWWNTSTAVYSNYKSFLPDVMQCSREWGRLHYFYATIVRVNEVVTVTTLDTKTRQPIAHGLTTGMPVTITGADQPTYDGTFNVTVASATTFTFIVTEAADTPATGDIEISIGLINCYEWVAAPVNPVTWDAYVSSLRGFDQYTGNVLNSSNPSYSTQDVWDVYGNKTTTYYFWVEKNTRQIPGKDISVTDIAGRLRRPAQYEIPYFGIMDAGNMFVFIGADSVEDNYGVEIAYEWQEMPRHIEWMLISEGSDFSLVPALVTDKLVDSILGVDSHGNPVPNVTLAPVDRFGTLNFPAQTVLQSKNDALVVFVEGVNQFLGGIDLTTLPAVFNSLSLSNETGAHADGYWTRATYWNPAINHTVIYDTVEQISELEFRTSHMFYAPGDVVKVLTSNQTDLWSGDPVLAYYQLSTDSFTASINHDTMTVTSINSDFLQIGQLLANSNNTISSNTTITGFGTGTGGVGTYTISPAQTVTTSTFYSWNLAGIEAHTAEINTNIAVTAQTFRDFFANITTGIDLLDANKLIFNLLYEMVRQNPTIDWFFKTSYIDPHVTLPLPMGNYIEPDQASLIFNAILDLKPYRTKIRQPLVTYSANDAIPVEMAEQRTTKMTLVFDRLACDLTDENSWDTIPWDATATYPESAGLIVTFIGNGIQTCFILPVAPTMENLVVFINHQIVIPDIDYHFDPVAGDLCFTSPPGGAAVITVYIDTNFEYFRRYSWHFTGDGSTDDVVLPSTISECTISDVFSVYNGVTQLPVTDFTLQVSTTTDVVYSTPATSNITVSGFVIGGVTDNIYNAMTFTADGVATTFSTGLTNLSRGADVIVTVDGVLQTWGRDFTFDNSSITNIKLAFPVVIESGAKILMYALVTPGNTATNVYDFIGDGARLFFPVPGLGAISPAKVIVSLDGIQQLDSVDYSLIATGVEFPVAPVSGVVVNIYVIWTGVGHRLTAIAAPNTIQWDWAFWNYADLGRQEFDLAGVAIGDGTTSHYTLGIPQTTTSLYSTKLLVYSNGVISSAAALGLTVTVTQLATSVQINFNAPMPNNAYAALYLSRGLYEGLEPTFGYQDPSGIILAPTPASYQHYFARLISQTFDPSTVMTGCPTPQERIQTGADDMYTIVVKTFVEEFLPPAATPMFGVAAVSGAGSLA